MADHYEDFPFEPIKNPEGDYFNSWAEAKAAGYDDDQVWSVIENDEEEVTEFDGGKSVTRTVTTTYGPPHHYINRLGYIVTAERHDGQTYYHETDSWEVDYDPELHNEEET